MVLKIEIKGIESAEQFLKDTNKEIFDKANQAVVKAGFFIEGEVKQSIAGQRAEPKSVDTGRFLNSVKTTQNAPLTASIETNIPYAKFLEYGTTKMEPRHHFTNTVQRNEINVKEFVEKEIKV